MILKITPKNTKKFLYTAIFYISFAIILFFISWKINNIFSYLFFIMAVLFLLRGYLYFFDAKECKGEECELKIKNDVLYIDDKSINLKGKSLFLESQKYDELFKVFLYEEKEIKTNLLLKAVLDEKEYIELLKLIKHYKKLPLYVEKTDGIFLCKNGFAINGREFFYNEISSIEWEVKTYRCRFGICSRYILVYIRLKDGNVVTTDIKEKDLNYAKLLYIKAILNNDKLEISGNKNFVKIFNKLIDKIRKDGCENLI